MINKVRKVVKTNIPQQRSRMRTRYLYDNSFKVRLPFLLRRVQKYSEDNIRESIKRCLIDEEL